MTTAWEEARVAAAMTSDWDAEDYDPDACANALGDES